MTKSNKVNWKDVRAALNEDAFFMNMIEDNFPTGSRVICNPAPADTDQDWVLYVKPKYRKAFIDYCVEECDFARSSEYDNNHADSLKKDDVNIILTRDAVTFNSWKVATKIAKKLNLLDKPDRQWLFAQIINLNENVGLNDALVVRY